MSEQITEKTSPSAPAVWEAITVTPLYFEAVGAGTGRKIPAGSRITVRAASDSDDVATFVDAGRSFEAIIDRVNCRPVEDFDALKARAGSD